MPLYIWKGKNLLEPWKLNSSTLHNIDERRNYTKIFYLTNRICDEVYIMILAVSLAAFLEDDNIKIIWVVLLSGTWCTCCTKRSSRCSVSFNEWGWKNSYSHIFLKKQESNLYFGFHMLYIKRNKDYFWHAYYT